MSDPTSSSHAIEEEFAEQSRTERARQTFRENKLAYYMIGPTILYILVLVWYPAIQGLVMSLFHWPLFGQNSFIGLDNYVYLLTWDTFYRSLFATLIYGTQTIGHLVFGTFMALLVWKQKRWVGAVSILFLLPYIPPSMVTGTIWRYIMDPSIGPFWTLMVDNLGLLSSPVQWLVNGDMALVVITATGVWTWSPLVFLLVIAALESIPEEHYELARIYGTSMWERFRYITYPQIRTALLIALIIRIIWNLGKVAQPFQMTRGGPGYSTSVLGILLYRLAWNEGQFGTAFAIGVILAIISLIFVTYFIYRFELEEGEVSMG